ncbi:histone deacetylase [Haliangium ochraceum]|uniref:Histone deacetylase n=1 Tax=Haliangium ochraceum (strain DSM 14365 / JCM 11303 / SMP-2) TaxID=502025 RepID=D0LJH4_HALO1|nr:histone deacetylase [Haliangium ochraceum]ACY16548.1 Histone deacetylase [Haliangium ochraceum DSM 14365]
MAIGYVLDDVFTEHRPPGSHPERPERIGAVRDALRAAHLRERATLLPVREASEDELGRVHHAGYLSDLTRTVPGQSGWLDGDTYFSPGTWEAVLKAAGAVVDVALGVLDARFQRGMALVRPPGHHAEADRAMGFCLINNIAVAAAAARAAGAARVAIVDWDVHHGNGTQHIFEEDPSVLFLSCHQYPFYPGTGAPSEVGRGAGVGATVNVGLPAGAGDRAYMATMNEVFAPALRRFQPDIILLSAGFDAYVDDPLAGMRVSLGGFRALAGTLARLADELCGGRLACALEGGYHLKGLGAGTVALLDAFEHPSAEAEVIEGDGEAPDPIIDSPVLEPRARAAIDATLAALDAAGGVRAPS